MGDQCSFGQTEARVASVLEHRISVAKCALCSIQGKALASGQIDRVKRFKTVLQLNTIRANVLYRRCADAAGNEGQIFKARVAVSERPGHKIVPVFACAGLDNPGFCGLADQSLPRNLDFKHQRFDVPGNDDVAATTQDKLLRVLQGGIG